MINRIVVGVDGSVGARAALLWAVDECRVRGDRTLLIVHAPDGAAAATPGGPELRALEELGERLLGAHAAAASARQPGVAVTTMLSHDPAAEILVALSRDTDLLVVGTHGRGSNLATILGSVSHRVAAHAHCPVAVVPERLTLNDGALAARVVVGVSASVSGRAALEFALDEAVRRNATVVAVRASDERGAVDPADALPGNLLRLVERFPGVRVEPALVVAEPADALLAAAPGAALVVVGCHHSNDRWSTRLGPVPSAILHRAPCPVVVVGQRRAVPVAAG